MFYFRRVLLPLVRHASLLVVSIDSFQPESPGSCSNTSTQFAVSCTWFHVGPPQLYGRVPTYQRLDSSAVQRAKHKQSKSTATKLTVFHSTLNDTFPSTLPQLPFIVCFVFFVTSVLAATMPRTPQRQPAPGKLSYTIFPRAGSDASVAANFIKASVRAGDLLP